MGKTYVKVLRQSGEVTSTSEIPIQLSDEEREIYEVFAIQGAISAQADKQAEAPKPQPLNDDGTISFEDALAAEDVSLCVPPDKPRMF